MKDNYRLALEGMFERFRACRIKELAEATGAEEKDGNIFLDFYGRRLKADPDAMTLTWCDDGSGVSTGDGLLILAYLIGANPQARETGILCSFREIRAAAVFEGAFLKSLAPYKKAFTGREDFLSCALRAGGEELPMGDAAVRMRPFLHIPIICVYYEGDDEFPADITVLYDKSITDFIHEENVPTLGTRTLSEIAKQKKETEI
ncbi:MAG: DUF3786 domain-containing protein [Eubacteriaceae bacterium]|nr:DUF3786 domain-containing protein [Eubacteriaceae bacterium]